MLRIKLSVPGFGDNLSISQYVGNSDNIIDGCQFFVNDSTLIEADYWFVIDGLQREKEMVSVAPENIYFLSAESLYPKGFFDTAAQVKFLSQFSKIFSCHDIFKENANYCLPFQVWMINANHGPSFFEKSERDVSWFLNLNNIEKSKQISVFCSNKIATEDHLLRYKFAKKVKDYFGEVIDWYGNGINPLAQKWEGIAPYKYHIVLENQSRHNIITEKLMDSFLGLSYPIYWGAPNVNDYFPRNSFKSIEILDWKNAIDSIEKTLVEDPWSKVLPNLIESKNIVLTKLNPFVRIKEIVDAHNSITHRKQPMILRSSEHFKITNGFLSHKIKQKAGSLLIKIANKIKE